MRPLIPAINSLLARAERLILALLLLTMMFLSSAQVMLRNLWHTGIPGLDLFNRALVVWITFLGASLATYYGKHIAIDAVLLTTAKPRLRCIMTLCANGFATMVLLFMLKTCTSYLFVERQSGAILVWGIPHWIVQIVFLYGFLVMSFRFFITTAQAAVALRYGNFNRYMQPN